MTAQPALGSGQMFDGIARRYDLLNILSSGGLDRVWRRKTVRALQLEPGARVLDVATGTADVALLAAKLIPGLRAVGLDPSQKMLELGAQKAKARGANVSFVRGDAMSLPFPERAFDGVTIAFGIRNVPDRPRALRELHRVLKPGARLSILELAEPRGKILGAMARLHVHSIVPRLGKWLSTATEYDYLAASIARFPPHEEFVETIRAAGFTQVTATPLTFGACVLFVAQRGDLP